MAACCYFGVDLLNQLDHNFPSRSTDGTPHSSSDLLYSFFLLPFTWTNYSKSNSISRFYSLGQSCSKSKISLLFALPGLKFPNAAPNLQKIPTQIFLLTQKNSLFLLTHSKLLPLESKQCPLRPASVLACEHSVDELRFRREGES